MLICLSVTSFTCQHVNVKRRNIIAGSLESANSSILAARRLFKDFGGEKNQDFMIIR